MAPTYRILPGLPPYGPMPAQFSADGKGSHREGLVVEFNRDDGPAWVGNFQRGDTQFDTVFQTCQHNTLTVIAGGLGYIVEPDSQRCRTIFGGSIHFVCALPDRTIFANDLWLEAVDGEKLLWSTQRLSWDGLRDVRVEGDRIVGNGYDPMPNVWIPFAVDIATGEATGGAYPPDLEVLFNKEAQVAKP